MGSFVTSWKYHIVCCNLSLNLPLKGWMEVWSSWPSGPPSWSERRTNGTSVPAGGEKKKLRSADWKQRSLADLSLSPDSLTYKIILHSQPLGAVLLQEPLQQLPACVRHIGLEYRRLVQDVVVHLSCVATVEWRLQRRKHAHQLKFI